MQRALLPALTSRQRKPRKGARGCRFHVRPDAGIEAPGAGFPACGRTDDRPEADNNSTDGTRSTVEAAATHFPVPLRYVFEAQPGKYWALNAGIRQAPGRYIAATDDDAFPEPDWLEGSMPVSADRRWS